MEFSANGARTWRNAELVKVSDDPYAWTQWCARWDVNTPGEYVLASRATDEAGHVQPLDPQRVWNRQGMGVNGVQRIAVTVQRGIGGAGMSVPSRARAALKGAEVPPVVRVTNSMDTR